MGVGAGTGPLVLLVEDDAIIALDSALELLAAGFAVERAASGEAAIEMVLGSSSPPAALVLDMDLGPGLDGAETARRLRALCDAPVVFHSGMDGREVARRAFGIGDWRLVGKGGGAELAKAVRAALDPRPGAGQGGRNDRERSAGARRAALAET